MPNVAFPAGSSGVEGIEDSVGGKMVRPEPFHGCSDDLGSRGERLHSKHACAPYQELECANREFLLPEVDDQLEGSSTDGSPVLAHVQDVISQA